MTQSLERRKTLITAACGLLFVATLAAGVTLVELNAPTGSTTSDPTLVSYYTQHKSRIEAGAGLGVLAVFFLLIYVSGLRDAVQPPQGDGRRTSIVAIGGGVAACFTALYFVFASAIPGAMDYAKPFTINPNTARVFSTLPYWFMVYATVATSLLVGASALYARRARVLPRWLTVSGVVLAVAAFASSAAAVPIGFPVLALWALTTSLVMLARAPRDEGATLARRRAKAPGTEHRATA